MNRLGNLLHCQDKKKHLFRDCFNHYSFGAVCQFLFEYLAGIRPTFGAPGFKTVLLKPTPGGNLTWAKCKYKTRNGVIRSEWYIADGMLHYFCSIPEKITAILQLPNGKTAVLTSGEHTFVETLPI